MVLAGGLQGDVVAQTLQLCERASIPPVRVHDLRHTMAALMR